MASKPHYLRILTGENHHKINLSANEKYEYGDQGCWYIKLTLFKRFKKKKKIPKKIK